MLKLTNIIFLFGILISKHAFSQDLEQRFKAEKLKFDKLEAANNKIILNSTEIVCSYHKDWGNILLRIGNDIYKNVDGEIVKVSFLKNGKSSWKEKIYSNYEVNYIDWQLVESGLDYYTIYMKLPIIGVLQHKCRS